MFSVFCVRLTHLFDLFVVQGFSEERSHDVELYFELTSEQLVRQCLLLVHGAPCELRERRTNIACVARLNTNSILILACEQLPIM